MSFFPYFVCALLGVDSLRGGLAEGNRIPEQLQSGHGGCEAVGGRLLAVGNAVGAGVGVWECLWGRVRAGVSGEGGYPPV